MRKPDKYWIIIETFMNNEWERIQRFTAQEEDIAEVEQQAREVFSAYCLTGDNANYRMRKFTFTTVEEVLSTCVKS